MRLSAMLRDVREGLASQPLRTALCVAGTAIGMGALAAVLAAVGGLREKSRGTIRGLGVNVFAVTADRAATGAGGLDRELAGRLRAGLAGCLVTAARVSDGEAAGLGGGMTLVGADEFLFRVRPWRIVAGRALDAEDLRAGARCAVLSAEAARRLRVGCGGLVSIRGWPFRVVGLADVQGGAPDGGPTAPALAPGDCAVFVPASVPPIWDDRAAERMPGYDAIFVKVEDPARFQGALRRAGCILASPDRRAGPVSWVTPRSLIAGLARLQRLIAVTGGAVALVCLLLAGSALTSLLLANVRERIPEIGLRRSLGASPRDVGLLFMLEAGLTTFAAAAFGTAAACGLLRLAADRLPVPLDLGPLPAAVPLAAGLVLGAAFSFWPARAAARIAPAEALRNA